MGRKACVAHVDSEDIGQQRMARVRARKASQAKGNLVMAKEKAKEASGKHARHLKGTAITVGNCFPTPDLIARRVVKCALELNCRLLCRTPQWNLVHA